MKKFFDFEKDDNDFIESALVSSKLSKMLEKLENGRKLCWWFTKPMLLLHFVLYLVLPREMHDPFLLVVFVIGTIFYNQIDTQIKIVKTIDRMKSYEE